jgi:predicted Fe-Mo cluster-binding NifX family protein
MIIAFSAQGDTLDAAMDLRLGRAERFVLVDSDSDVVKVVETQAVQAVHGAGIQTAQLLVKAGAKAVVSGDCGPKAFQVLQAAGVPVFSVGGGTVREALQAFKARTLPEIGKPGKAHQG